MTGREWKGIQTDWNATALMTTDENISVCLSQREIGIILSALTPAKWRTRWENLPESQSLDFIDDLVSKLMMTESCEMNCDDVANCIETSPAVNSAITEIITNNNYGDRNTVIGAGNPVFDSCNEDIIFGATTYLIDYVNTSIVDALEIIEVSTNFIEAIQLWAENAPFPIVGQLASRLLQAIAWIQDNIAENYLANYTTGLRDTYRCDLFCIWMESPDCKLTAGDVALYFASRVGAQSFFSTLSDSITFLIAGVWSGPQIVDAMFALVMISMTADDAIGWFRINGLYEWNVAVALGSNNPDADWSILCDECITETWCHDIDFTLSDGGFTRSITPNRGVYVPGVGWNIASTPSGADRCGVYIQREFALSAITSVELTYSLSSATPERAVRLWLVNDGVFANVIYQEPADNGTGVIKSWSGTANVDEIQIVLDANLDNDCTTQTGAITGLRIAGTGVNPFGADNCD